MDPIKKEPDLEPVSQKRGRSEITLERKYQIIQYVEKLESEGSSFAYKNIAEMFNLRPSTFSDMLKKQNREKVKRMIECAGVSGSMKRVKLGPRRKQMKRREPDESETSSQYDCIFTSLLNFSQDMSVEGGGVELSKVS